MILTLELKRALSVNLKHLRDLAGVSQTQVCNSVGITQKSYSEIESGKRWPQHETLVKLAEYFKVEETDLMTDKNLLALRDLVNKSNLKSN